MKLTIADINESLPQSDSSLLKKWPKEPFLLGPYDLIPKYCWGRQRGRKGNVGLKKVNLVKREYFYTTAQDATILAGEPKSVTITMGGLPLTGVEVAVKRPPRREQTVSLTVRLANGETRRIPREWTDYDTRRRELASRQASAGPTATPETDEQQLEPATGSGNLSIIAETRAGEQVTQPIQEVGSGQLGIIAEAEGAERAAQLTQEVSSVRPDLSAEAEGREYVSQLEQEVSFVECATPLERETDLGSQSLIPVVRVPDPKLERPLLTPAGLLGIQQLIRQYRDCAAGNGGRSAPATAGSLVLGRRTPVTRTEVPGPLALAAGEADVLDPLALAADKENVSRPSQAIDETDKGSATDQTALTPPKKNLARQRRARQPSTVAQPVAESDTSGDQTPRGTSRRPTPALSELSPNVAQPITESLQETVETSRVRDASALAGAPSLARDCAALAVDPTGMQEPQEKAGARITSSTESSVLADADSKESQGTLVEVVATSAESVPRPSYESLVQAQRQRRGKSVRRHPARPVGDTLFEM